MTGPARVVVANPGSVPEIRAAATGLSRAGMLGRYHAPLAFSDRAERIALRGLPTSFARTVACELRRRSLPTSVPLAAAHQTATASEVFRLAVDRSPLRRRARFTLLRRQARVFDERVARALDGSDTAVLGVAAAARETLRRARELGIRSFLDYPIVHHRTLLELTREEAARAPMFADTLPSPEMLKSMATALDEEISLAERILSLSSFTTRSFLQAGIERERIIEIPPGVDTKRFRPGPRGQDGTFRILFVGQVTQRKGLSDLLDAFRLIGLPEAELVIAGALQGDLHQWKEQPGVRYVPAMTQAALPPLYQSADVYVMPSIAEGSCLTALEAMACGLPVIVSENTGTGDLITDGENGYVVPIRDSASIARRLGELHADPGSRHAIGAAARRRSEQLTWDVYGRRVAEALAV